VTFICIIPGLTTWGGACMSSANVVNGVKTKRELDKKDQSEFSTLNSDSPDEEDMR
jgi:hypothetical protein